MRLWILRPTSSGRELFYRCPWGAVDKIIVRAETEIAARQLAAEDCVDNFTGVGLDPSLWLNTFYSSCESLFLEGEPGVVLARHV